MDFEFDLQYFFSVGMFVLSIFKPQIMKDSTQNVLALFFLIASGLLLFIHCIKDSKKSKEKSEINSYMDISNVKKEQP